MKHPQEIETMQKGATYTVPQYQVKTNEGLVDFGRIDIRFCKGNKQDASAFRQGGFLTETLLAVCRQYLLDVNVGDLASRETSMAITKIDEALLWIGKRAEDRKIRGVQGTYEK